MAAEHVTRPHPFDLVFRDLVPVFETWRAAGAGQLRDLAGFAANGEVKRLLAEVEEPDVVAHDPTAAAEYHMAMFAAFRFWDAGEHTCETTRDALERATGEPVAINPPDVPGGACYVRLPVHMFWAQVAPGEPHEPLDGVFVTVSPAGDRWTAVLVLGLRPDRRGFSQVSLTVHHAELGEAFAALTEPAFAPAMDGGDQAGFRSVRTAAEALVLIQLALVQTGR